MALPTKQQIVDFVRDHPGRVAKREIARAFHIGGADRIWLKRTLKEMAEEGLLERGRARTLRPPGVLPEVALLDIVETDIDGELIARPVEWPAGEPAPRVVLAPLGRAGGGVGIGDRVLARLNRLDGLSYEGRLIRRVEGAPELVLGVYSKTGREGRLTPTDRRQRRELSIPDQHARGALVGELVLAEILPGARAHGPPLARVTERLGPMGDPRSLSLVAIHTHAIPTRFGADSLAEAAAMRPISLGKRSDLRDLPLVTIDPEDARDRDDAVWAAPDDDAKNRGGWIVIVAIADVAHYVRPGSALDRDARLRGNSVYFPDRVVPMLPDILAADLCSLHATKPRACLAVTMRFDAGGNKIGHGFARALMRSAAALEYGQVQRAHDGRPDEATAPLLDPVIRPLYRAYAALSAARERRGPLAIDLPERRVELGPDGFIAAIRPRERHDSHRLIEEFMIAANVAAAETLEQLKQPCMYRVHEEPARDKVDALREFLDSLGLRLAKGQVLKPELFNRVLAQAAGTPHHHLVNQVVLRAQAQALYAAQNIGHFGLALRRYAHFTSPIRRYSDLLVHRALIAGLGLGPGGLASADIANFAATAEHISQTERRAMAAERDAMDRFAAAFMSEKVGANFAGRINGVTRFGLFVELADSGADGLIPISTLGDDYYQHDERNHALVGRHSGRVFRLGDRIDVRLAEADKVTGGLRLELVRDAGLASPPGALGRGGRPRFVPPRGKRKGRR